MPVYLPPLSRRHFLARALSGAAGLLLASRLRATRPDRKNNALAAADAP